MNGSMDQINMLQKEIDDLRKILSEKENELYRLKNEWFSNQPQRTIQNNDNNGYNNFNKSSKLVLGDTLPKWAVERYSRQILLPEIGVRGQERLCAAKVLVVGAGGLGCPAAVYLAGAGVGEIGIVDYDTVDLTNIHRQFLHNESDTCVSKAESAANKLRSINSRIKITPYNMQLDSKNALDLASKYDIILDCTDNVPTRYLLNDLCAITKLPLISGSALKLEGQLTVYGYRAEKNDNEQDKSYSGPCYRCVFPSPPPAETVGSCSSAGVAGPVPGVIGALQALETIKYIIGQTSKHLLVERMLLFDGEDQTFRTVKLRQRNPQCPACSDTPAISHLIDYEVFCKAQAKEKKKLASRQKSERRKQEKLKRMTGQSYYGFRLTNPGDIKKKWIQDVPKNPRRMGPPCAAESCTRNSKRGCSKFQEDLRQDIFNYFWVELDWRGKRGYVKSLIDLVPAKRRRLKHKGDVSRKGDSKVYHLFRGGERVAVCRGMFLNTLGVKEAMVRCWLTNEDRPKTTRRPEKALNVQNYVDSLPKTTTTCQFCIRNGSKAQYINIDNVKNILQLYNLYVRDMRVQNVVPASRKTFSKVIALRNLRVYKSKDGVCDMVDDHNAEGHSVYEKNINYYEAW